MQPPNRLDNDAAAAQVVAAVKAGDPVDPLALGRRVIQSADEGRAFDQARQVLREAQDQASNAAIGIASDAVERIITEHLRPTLEDVMQHARESAALLAGYGLDAMQILRAPTKVRNAYLELGPLVSRRAAILDARRHANSVGYRQPNHDHGGLFLTFREPMTFFPDYRPPAQIPQLPIPTDPTERLLFLVGDEAAAAEPWLPTVAEQDAAWWAESGEGVTNRAQAAEFARGFSVH